MQMDYFVREKYEKAYDLLEKGELEFKTWDQVKDAMRILVLRANNNVSIKDILDVEGYPRFWQGRDLKGEWQAAYEALIPRYSKSILELMSMVHGGSKNLAAFVKKQSDEILEREKEYEAISSES